MKVSKALYLIVIAVSAIGCSSDNQSQDILPCIDVRKNYPEKEIILTDIADVDYLCLNSDDDDFLYKGRIHCVTENTIVVIDDSSGSILFFSREGSPKSRFNRKGQGPEEYIDAISILVVYDEDADDVFVHQRSLFAISGNSILVYSSTGEFKRKITLPGGAAFPLIDFDDQSLFLYDMQNQQKKALRALKGTDFTSQSVDSSFYRISKTDGTVLEYVEFLCNEIDLTDFGIGNRVIHGYSRLVNSTAGLFLCNPESDTVFLYGKDKILTPIICKTPLVRNSNPRDILDDFLDTERYQFIRVQTLINSDDVLMKIPQDERYNRLNKNYIHDKQTNEIFRQKINLSDYKGKEFFITAQKTHLNGKEMLTHFELDLYELKEAYEANKLSGKLKELVATLDENKDNNVFMLVNFK